MRLLPRRHTVPAFIALVLALVALGNGTYFIPQVLACLGGGILAAWWLIRLIIFLIRRKLGKVPADPSTQALLHWSLEPCALALVLFAVNSNFNSEDQLNLWPVFLCQVALLISCGVRFLIRLCRGRLWPDRVPAELYAFFLVTICCFTCSIFIGEFALSYPSLASYVRGVAASAPFHLSQEQAAEWNRAHPDGDNPLPSSTDQWYVDDSPKRRAGLFPVEETLASRSGDVLLVTRFGSELISSDIGIYYTVDHQFLRYHDVVGEIGSYELGSESRYSHIFGPWYVWVDD